jgi:hypothetical protein
MKRIVLLLFTAMIISAFVTWDTFPTKPTSAETTNPMVMDTPHSHNSIHAKP